MCFHTSTTFKTKKLEAFYKVKLGDESNRDNFDKPNYHLNGFSHPNMLIIPQQKSNVLTPAVWGIVPSGKSKSDIKPYFKESVKYGGGLNARSEKVFKHIIYKDSIMTKRCIIPVSGFFEPHDQKGKKYPFYITTKNEEPISLAGLYTIIDTVVTFTILTKEASPLFEKIHNKKKRQPLILDIENAHNWLSVDLNESDIHELLNVDYTESTLNAYTVNKELFSPKFDSNVEGILNPVNYQELDLKV
ncbi:SOS response-associated peptidase [Bizionia myxarmorum]|uniref:Abasic site processing protein n=1 Tax=Bizionia myxarmorum TaxID=291186 RepID=A0A5D0R7N6_9FLAO|nr:SOS response-associated peptidase family protein [Bizionia myxarmorum]TYB76846.1 SOS response-associated peptidase [Bizionia myxarmorum]